MQRKISRKCSRGSGAARTALLVLISASAEAGIVATDLAADPQRTAGARSDHQALARRLRGQGRRQAITPDKALREGVEGGERVRHGLPGRTSSLAWFEPTRRSSFVPFVDGAGHVSRVPSTGEHGTYEQFGSGGTT